MIYFSEINNELLSVNIFQELGQAKPCRLCFEVQRLFEHFTV